MSKLSRVKQSRNKWKTTAVERATRIRYLRRENARIKKDRNKYKTEAKKVFNTIKEQQSTTRIMLPMGKQFLVFISLLLFCVARLSFRAVSRTIDVLGDFLGLKKNMPSNHHQLGE